MCLVAAPAGFGKTSLLAQWRQRRLAQGEVAGWLTLDEADAEPHQFLAYLVTALGAAGLDMGSLGVGLEQGTTRSALEPAVHTMLDVIAAHVGPVSIVLDDYHRAEGTGPNAILSLAVAHAPDNLSIILDSRVRPTLNLAQLIASGRAVEIDAERLRFSEAETVAALGGAIGDDRLRDLHQRAAGWPVVVQLARVLIGEADRGTSPFDRFGGGDGHVANYLSEEVLSALPQDLQDFLIRTSFLERFNVDLANAVTGRVDGGEAMKQLEPLRALIVPLADSEGWFRYHHLFAECLIDHLRRRFPEDMPELHSRASRWFADQGDVVDAVRHARAAGSVAGLALNKDDVIRIVTANGGGYGDPRNRDRDSVIQDLRNGYVSAAQARSVYGLETA